MQSKSLSEIFNVNSKTLHPKCKGYIIHTFEMREFDCGYDTVITCDECKYGAWGGRKKS